MDLELRGRTAVVTGGNKGIGAAVAAALAAEGVDLALVARDAGQLEDVAGQLRGAHGVRVECFSADLRSPDAVTATWAGIARAFEHVDILVNNAGATRRGHFLALTEDDWQDGYALKLHGYVRMSRAAWPALQARQGCLINIVGVGSRVGTAEFTIGGSVNAALLNLTKALADLGRPLGVRVNAVNPGRIATDRLNHNIDRIAATDGVDRDTAVGRLLAAAGIERFGKPEEIGSLVAFLASPRAAFIHGSIVDADGGETRAL